MQSSAKPLHLFSLVEDSGDADLKLRCRGLHCSRGVSVEPVQKTATELCKSRCICVTRNEFGRRINVVLSIIRLVDDHEFVRIGLIVRIKGENLNVIC